MKKSKKGIAPDALVKPKDREMPCRLSYEIVLASASPRRQEILLGLGFNFVIAPPEINESALLSSDPWQSAKRIAKEKAFVAFEQHPSSLVIAADTIVALQKENGDYEAFGKPKDREDAIEMLKSLSGREHLVITGVVLRWPKGMHAFTETTYIEFQELTSQEVSAYVDLGESIDKAGGYGIQGKAKSFLKQVRGSVSNVVGLPVEALLEALKDIR